MSLLGVDVGTSGCKVSAFSEEGQLLSLAYQEYDYERPQTGWAELDASSIWQIVKQTIRQVVSEHPDPASIRALSVSSMGEAFGPVTRDRRILGPTLLNFDVRGEEYVSQLRDKIDNRTLFAINGNVLGNHYSLTKLLWLRDHRPELVEQTDYFLHWSGFVLFMLGGEPAIDRSLANRTLLFDLVTGDWSSELVSQFGIDRTKLPDVVPAGSLIGSVSGDLADELGLPPTVALVVGVHDQCANALGCGAIHPGQAAYGMGTYICITPVYRERRDPALMIERGLNTEHHAVPGMFVSFIYNPGGALVKWYRDTFAQAEYQQAWQAGQDVYDTLFDEVLDAPSPVIVLPHFAPTGPPEFVADSSGVMVGLRLETTRGEILKGILEGTTYYLKACVDALPSTGIQIESYRVAGGGSKSDKWVQICADILERPFVRARITEAGTLGAAVMAGVGASVFNTFDEGVEEMVRLDRVFEPNPARSARYRHRFEHYRQLWPMMRPYLHDLATDSVIPHQTS